MLLFVQTTDFPPALDPVQGNLHEDGSCSGCSGSGSGFSVDADRKEITITIIIISSVKEKEIITEGDKARVMKMHTLQAFKPLSRERQQDAVRRCFQQAEREQIPFPSLESSGGKVCACVQARQREIRSLSSLSLWFFRL